MVKLTRELLQHPAFRSAKAPLNSQSKKGKSGSPGNSSSTRLSSVWSITLAQPNTVAFWLQARIKANERVTRHLSPCTLKHTRGKGITGGR